MEKRKNVLIYPGNGCNALEVFKCLKYSLRYKPILGNNGYTYGEYLTEDCYTNLDRVYDPMFVSKLNAFIDEKNIKFIIPTHDTVCEEMMKNKAAIKAHIVCSSYETAHICRHKKLTYQVLSDLFFLPKVYVDYEGIASTEYPVFAKDEIGQGGKNTFIAKNYYELLVGLQNMPETDYVVVEYLPGDEITIDCFTDREGKLRFWQARERVSILDGMSEVARTVQKDKEIEKICRSINERIQFRGYWFIQCKRDRYGNYKLMEISTRFSGTFCVSGNLDVNLPLLALTDAEDMDITVFPNKYDITSARGYEVRYKLDLSYSTVYFDFDDTLVFDRKYYNPIAFAFLLQCKNEGKRVLLITRHCFPINETLKSLHIDKRLFDEIISIPREMKKSEFINDADGILIDNSFSDRLDVKEKYGMPAFDICSLDALLK